MGKNQKKLIKMMDYKALRISNTAEVPVEMYFSEKDKQALQDLFDMTALKTVQTMIRRLEAWNQIPGRIPSDIASNPFCWIFKCKECPYGEHHGMCNEPELPNDYLEIRKILQEKKGKEVVLLNSVCNTRTMINLLKFGVRV